MTPVLTTYQYRCPVCALRTGGQMALGDADLRCKCGATLVEVNADCPHTKVRSMVREGRYQCQGCGRILTDCP